MNLALKDIQFNLLRFALTVAGMGFLVTAAVGAIGLYRGIVADALLIIRQTEADLWVVQGERAGPFAEGSAVAADLDLRVDAVDGVSRTRRFIQSGQQFEAGGRTLRAVITGLDFPEDGGFWIPVEAGRRMESSHYEAIADRSIGLEVGDVVRIARDDYEIVGLTRGMVDSLGDGLMFVSINDALTIAHHRTSEEILNDRATASPGTGQGAQTGPDRKVAAILVTLSPGADLESVRATLMSWGDVNVLSRAEQEDLLLNQRMWRLRVQILAFTVVLLIVMTIVTSLIIYTLTIEKLHQIAMLKLMGARNSMIVAMILQQAAAIGVGGFCAGVFLSWTVFPFFPRRVVIETGDLLLLLFMIVIISGAAGLVGVSRAMKVRAQEVLA